MNITNEQFLGINDKSFIDKFDPEKHKLEKYKLILVLGKTIINGENQDGNCLFIPFDSWNSELREGDCQDGNTYGYYHYNYLVRALASTNYTFPDSFIQIIDFAKKNIQTKNVDYDDFYKDLFFQGVSVIVNFTYYNVYGDSNLEYGYYIPSKPTDEQKKTLLEIMNELELTPENTIEIAQYEGKEPIRVQNRMITKDDEIDDFFKLLKTGKLINCHYKKEGEGYICNYLYRQGDFEEITREELLSILKYERSV